MVDSALGVYRARWQEKPVLRTVYADMYRRIAAACISGPTLEVGGGAGNFKDYAPNVLSTDLQAAPWLDAVVDAQVLPFAETSFANIVGVDVLHHMHRPRCFFTEVTRVLRPAGRVVLVEPAITPLSWPIYHFLHEEPVRMGEDPLADTPPNPGCNPYDANQAIPTTLFGRYRSRFHRIFPSLRLVARQHFGLIAYPLSGGFKEWSLLPARLAPPLLRLEDSLGPLLGRMMGFRMLVVVERRI